MTYYIKAVSILINKGFPTSHYTKAGWFIRILKREVRLHWLRDLG